MNSIPLHILLPSNHWRMLSNAEKSMLIVREYASPIFEKCNIDEHKSSYLQDITYKL